MQGGRFAAFFGCVVHWSSIRPMHLWMVYLEAYLQRTVAFCDVLDLPSVLTSAHDPVQPGNITTFFLPEHLHAESHFHTMRCNHERLQERRSI